MPSDVNIKVGADTVGFHREMRGVETAVTKVGASAQASFGALKGYLIGAIGIGTIDKMVGASLEYGNAILKTSKVLGTSIDRAAQLNKVVESMGENGEWLAKSMEKSQKFIRSAIGDSSKLALLKKFGIGQEDIKNYDYSTVLNKALMATKNMSRADAQLGLSDIFGRGTGAMLMSRREQILAPTATTGIDAKSLAEIKAAQFALKELNANIKILILQAILPLISVIGSWIVATRDKQTTFNAKMDKAAEIWKLNNPKATVQEIDKFDKRMSLAKARYGGFIAQGKNSESATADAISTAFTGSPNALWKPEYLEDIIDKVNAGVVDTTTMSDTYKKSIKEAMEKNATDNAITKEDLPNTGKGIPTDEFIRMGGVMGITNSRVEELHLAKRQVEIQEKILDYLLGFSQDNPMIYNDAQLKRMSESGGQLGG